MTCLTFLHFCTLYQLKIQWRNMKQTISSPGQKIRIYSILESTCHSLESTHISKRNRLKLNLFTLLIANGLYRLLSIPNRLEYIDSNIRPCSSPLRKGRTKILLVKGTYCYSISIRYLLQLLVVLAKAIHKIWPKYK